MATQLGTAPVHLPCVSQNETRQRSHSFVLISGFYMSFLTAQLRRRNKAIPFWLKF